MNSSQNARWKICGLMSRDAKNDVATLSGAKVPQRPTLEQYPSNPMA